MYPFGVLYLSVMVFLMMISVFMAPYNFHLQWSDTVQFDSVSSLGSMLDVRLLMILKV